MGVENQHVTMKPIIALIILLYCSTTFSLKCLECSEKSTEEAKKCSVNSTNYRESADGYCRLWSVGEVAVHRSLVSEAECTETKLKQNVDNDIIGKFPGEGVAQAQCCNWTLCNYNVTWAALTEAPSMAAPLTNLHLVNVALALLITFLVNKGQK